MAQRGMYRVDENSGGGGSRNHWGVVAGHRRDTRGRTVTGGSKQHVRKKAKPKPSTDVSLDSFITKALEKQQSRKHDGPERKVSAVPKHSKAIKVKQHEQHAAKHSPRPNPNALDSTAPMMVRYGKQKASGGKKKKRPSKLKRSILRNRRLMWYLLHPDVSPVPLRVHPALSGYISLGALLPEASKDAEADPRRPPRGRHEKDVPPSPASTRGTDAPSEEACLADASSGRQTGSFEAGNLSSDDESVASLSSHEESFDDEPSQKQLGNTFGKCFGFDPQKISPVYFGGRYLSKCAGTSREADLQADGQGGLNLALGALPAALAPRVSQHLQQEVSSLGHSHHSDSTGKARHAVSCKIASDLYSIIRDHGAIQKLLRNAGAHQAVAWTNVLGVQSERYLRIDFIDSQKSHIPGQKTSVFDFALLGFDNFARAVSCESNVTALRFLKSLLKQDAAKKFQLRLGPKQPSAKGNAGSSELHFVHVSSGSKCTITVAERRYRWGVILENLAQKVPTFREVTIALEHWAASQAKPASSLSAYSLGAMCLIYLTQRGLASWTLSRQLVESKSWEAVERDLLASVRASLVPGSGNAANSAVLLYGFFAYFGGLEESRTVLSLTGGIKDARANSTALHVQDPSEDEVSNLLDECSSAQVPGLLLQFRCTAMALSNFVQGALKTCFETAARSLLELDATPSMSLPVSGLRTKVSGVEGAPHYVSQALSHSLDQDVSKLLETLVEFQERLRTKDPVRAKMRRRLVFGFNEVFRGVKLRRCKLVIVAPNIEQLVRATDSALNDTLEQLLSTCKVTTEEMELGLSDIPVVFALNKRKIGKCARKNVGISVVGVYSADGAHSQFKSVVAKGKRLRDVFDATVSQEQVSGVGALCSVCHRFLEFERYDCVACNNAWCTRCADSRRSRSTPCPAKGEPDAENLCEVVRILRRVPFADAEKARRSELEWKQKSGPCPANVEEGEKDGSRSKTFKLDSAAPVFMPRKRLSVGAPEFTPEHLRKSS